MLKWITERYKALSIPDFLEQISAAAAAASASPVLMVGAVLAVGLMVVSGVRVCRHELWKQQLRDMLGKIEHSIDSERDLREYKVTIIKEVPTGITMNVTAKGKPRFTSFVVLIY